MARAVDFVVLADLVGLAADLVARRLLTDLVDLVVLERDLGDELVDFLDGEDWLVVFLDFRRAGLR